MGYFYREDTLTVMSSNTPVQLVKPISDVEVNKGKTVTIDNIFQYVYDEENDPVTVSIKNVSAADVVDIQFVDDKVNITGTKGWWAKTLVTLEFRDEQGNAVETSFKVSVGDPWAVVLIVSILLLIIIFVLCIIYMLYKKTFLVRGKMRIALLEKRVDGKTSEIIFEDKNRRFKDPLKQINNDFITKDSSNDLEGFGFAPLNEDTTNETDIENDIGFGFGDSAEESSDINFDKNNKSNNQDISKLEYELADSFSTGEIQLGSFISKKQDSMYSVLNEFVQRLKYHIIAAGSLEKSAFAQNVENFIKYNFSEFNNIKIQGSSLGRQGIVLVNKSKAPIRFLSPRINKNKLSTKSYGRKLVVIKISIPMSTENANDSKSEAYIEIEYINN